MVQFGELIDLTKIISEITKIKNINSYGANYYTYYYAPIFTNTKIIENIPVIVLNSIDEYILMEITIPNDGFIDNVNLFNITPYFYSYKNDSIFASVDKTLEFFKPKLNPSDTIKIVFTSSKTIGTYFENKGYIISKIPAEYLQESTYNFLIRIGNLSGTYEPGSFIKYSKIILDKFVSTEPIIPYSDLDIILSLPTSLSSKYIYDGQIELNNKLLNFYNEQKKFYLKLGYDEIPTYLYLQNIPNPHVNYAFQSFYDAISVKPYIKMQANNTGESYFNSELIDLNNYVNLEILIMAVNQNEYGYGIYSNIHIYNKSGLEVIENGSYLTSPNIPVISEPSYPYVDEKSAEYLNYPLINIKKYNVNDILSQGIKEIYIVERVGYNPINFSHPDDYHTPKFSVFISKPK